MFFFYKQEQKKLTFVYENSIENIHYAYEKVLKKYNKFYSTRILANIHSKGVQEALLSKEKEKLYELVEGRWKVLKEENEHLLLMRFYHLDAQLFLKMESKQESLYDTNSYRSIVREMLQKKEPMYGFEEDANLLAYRIIYPIFHKQEMIGALELGFSPEFFLEELLDLYKIQSALYIKETIQPTNPTKLDGYYQKYNTLENKNLFNKILKNYDFESFITFTTKQKNFMGLYTLSVEDLHFKEAGKLLFFIDFTKEKELASSNLFLLGSILFGTIITLLIVITFVFNRNIRILEKEHKSMQQYKKMIDENVIAATLDLHCNFTNVSEAFMNISGYEKSLLMGKKMRLIGHPDMPNIVYEKIDDALRNKQNFQGEMQFLKENGENFWVYVVMQPKYKKEVLIGYEVIMQDITEKKRNEELLITDSMTQIYNRRHFNDIFPRMIQSTKRDGGYLSFLLLDIDNFKLFNDTYGHQAGDNALISVATVLNDSLKRGDDYCFRLGGEEFAIVYKSSSEHDAYLFAQKIRKNIMALEIKHEKNGNEGILTASFGLVTLRDFDLTTMDDIFQRADEYLYCAKDEGRNKIISRMI